MLKCKKLKGRHGDNLYIYVCVCVCVCVYFSLAKLSQMKYWIILLSHKIDNTL